ncbi:MAG: hypothetical protein LCI00_23580 [Chloroflexi bacterium]|nr:hypothetical protein [Chloroflexota bacterium]MCC6896037.1 hypothetical protein [Anaerolineae bacterium]
MNDKIYGHKHLTSCPSAAVCEDEGTGHSASVVNASIGVHYPQIALLIKQSLTTNVTEPCLSPLLWSESFGLRLDG